MRARTVVPLLAILSLALFALPASAQSRPTLERIETVMCLQADEDGDGYRPIFCDPRCDCRASVNLALAESCWETNPGVVTVVGLKQFNSAESVCMGFCLSSPETRCASNSGCGSGGCFLGAGECTENVMPCTADTDCDQAKGYSCDLSINRCTGPACAAQGTCEFVDVRSFVMSSGVAASSDPTPLACEMVDLFGPDFDANINSRDAAECITQVEAQLGTNACIICGDGNLDAGEQCDDGNLTAGDGCAPDCTTE